MNFSWPLRDIEQSILDLVFLEWIERLRRYIATNDEYLAEASTSIVGEVILCRWGEAPLA
jgi:hypothetical protein